MTKRHIVEGEAFGAPVPGGWPDKGPFEAIRQRVRRHKPSGDVDNDQSGTSDDEAEGVMENS